MKSKIQKVPHLISGGNIRDLKIIFIMALFFILSALNIFRAIFILRNYETIANAIICFIITVIVFILKNDSYPIIFFLSSVSICFLSHETYYNSLSIFIIMIYVTSKNKFIRNILLFLLLIIGLLIASINQENIIDIFAIIIQFVFALFCYYGFIYIRVKDISYHSKLIYTEEERIILHALATQDKSQKEVAYELHISIPEMTYILNKIKKKNSISTTDMLLRLYAIENALNQNS